MDVKQKHCSVEGCDRTRVARGMCSKHYLRWSKRGDASAADRRIRHGMSKTAEYRIWVGIIRRCHSASLPGYRLYGARGIFMCDEWRNSFPAFFAHVGKRPSSKHSINRVDNNKGYEPGNVQWATMTVQSRNKRNGVLLTINGVTMCLQDWVRQPGATAHRRTVALRLANGIDPFNAVFAPLNLTPRARITQEQANEIRRRYAQEKISQAALAKEYEICGQAMSNIIRGKTWIEKAVPSTVIGG